MMTPQDGKDTVRRARARLLEQLFPGGVPSLWCPPLTHYTAEGALDRARISAHWSFLSPHVKGLLVPGTTGDGWELSADETRHLVDIALDEARRLDVHVLLGALHPDAGVARETLGELVALLKRRSGVNDLHGALRESHVCGFAVCPPRGADATQEELKAALGPILEAGAPVALYQLPQVTENEMSPELVAELAGRYPHFILLKDTSGRDLVATSGLDLLGAHLVRGMEGDYESWLKVGGGPYDGFLLSAANSFGGPLSTVRELLAAGRSEEAKGISDRLTRTIEGLFQVVDSVEGGNPFANASKLADHFHAHGPEAVDVPPPRLHSGHGLTAKMLSAAAEILRAQHLMPRRGYLRDGPDERSG